MIFGKNKKKPASNLEAFLNEEKGGFSSKNFFTPNPISAPAAPVQTPVTPIPERPISVPVTPRPEKTTPPTTPISPIQQKPVVNRPKTDFRNPEILDLDLVGQVSEGQIDGRRYFNLIVVALLMTAIVVAQVYFIISWWKNNSSTSEDLIRNTTQAQKEIKNFQKTADEALSFSKRADLITPLMNNHIYWSNFFRYLERNTLSTVTFEGFTGDNKGEYTLEATSLHYSDINWQVKKFLSDDYTISATVSEGSTGDKGTGKLSTPISSTTDPETIEEGLIKKPTNDEKVSFTLKLKVKPELFLIPPAK